jgi:hypothetical protein
VSGSQRLGGGDENRQGKAAWEAIVSSAVALGTFVFGVVSWWDGRNQTKRDAANSAQKVVVVAAPASATTAREEAVRPKVEAEAVPALVPHALKLSNGRTLYYFRNLSLSGTHNRVQKAVVVVPGSQTAANGELYQGVMEQARRAGRDADTLILVPAIQTSDRSLREGEPYWEKSWEVGGQSSGENPISSFRMIDELVAAIADPARRPNLRTIVLAGNNHAGAFVNRYIAGGHPNIPSRINHPPIDLRFVVIGAPSYLYLDNYRPVAGSESFEIPTDGNCPDDNRYRYGLEARNPYMARVPVETLRANMMGRQAAYVSGALDTDTHSLDITCGAVRQGRNRYERAVNYKNYIGRFPDWQKNVEFHVLPGVGHVSMSTADIPAIRNLLFGLPEKPVGKTRR